MRFIFLVKQTPQDGIGFPFDFFSTPKNGWYQVQLSCLKNLRKSSTFWATTKHGNTKHGKRTNMGKKKTKKHGNTWKNTWTNKDLTVKMGHGKAKRSDQVVFRLGRLSQRPISLGLQMTPTAHSPATSRDSADNRRVPNREEMPGFGQVDPSSLPEKHT